MEELYQIAKVAIQLTIAQLAELNVLVILVIITLIMLKHVVSVIIHGYNILYKHNSL